MQPAEHDISRQMQPKAQAAATGGSGVDSSTKGGAALSPVEFSSRLDAASRTLWLIAASVLGQREGAEDVVQESALIGLQKIGEFDSETNFAAWMGGIVRNVARNAARKSHRRHTSSADPAMLDTSTPASSLGPSTADETEVDQSSFDQHVLAALNELEEVPRACLLLRTVRQMSYREIAAVLAIPEGTAMSHVHRARHAMRKRLSNPPQGGARV